MQRLTKKEFDKMNLAAVSVYHGMKELDFVLQAFPMDLVLLEKPDWYSAYLDWYTKTQNKLAKALK